MKTHSLGYTVFNCLDQKELMKYKTKQNNIYGKLWNLNNNWVNSFLEKEKLSSLQNIINIVLLNHQLAVNHLHQGRPVNVVLSAGAAGIPSSETHSEEILDNCTHKIRSTGMCWCKHHYSSVLLQQWDHTESYWFTTKIYWISLVNSNGTLSLLDLQ